MKCLKTKRTRSGISIPIHSDNLNHIYTKLLSHFGIQKWWPGDSPFEIIVGAILTQNTNWNNVKQAIDNLKYNGMLDPAAMLTNKRRLPGLIKPSGYYRIKSKRLLNFVHYLIDNHQGSIKHMRQKRTSQLRKELLGISGIGPETADSILLYAIGKPVFVIDTYTKRILSRHNIISKNCTYETCRTLLQQHLPKNVNLYQEFHALFVVAGKEYCKKNDPDCNHCPLADLRRIS